MTARVHCSEHGQADSTIVCVHICETLRDGQARGFLWSFDEQEGDYQAVCQTCREMDTEEWRESAVDLGRVICLECFKRAATMNQVEVSR